MSAGLAALREGAVRVLAGGGHDALAMIVRDADLELLGRTQTWQVGDRALTAQTLVLTLSAEAFVALRATQGGLDEVRGALAALVRSPTTELAELLVVVRLPIVEQTWEALYRGAATRTAPERPPPEAVLRAASELLAALGDARSAAMLASAELEVASVPSSAELVVVRYVLRLLPVDLATVQRDDALAERIKRALADAGTRAFEQVSGIELRARVEA